MRKIEELKQELKKYFRDIDVFYDLEDGQITNVLLVLRKDNVVYNADGLRVDLYSLVCFSIENNIITITDKNADIFEINLIEDQFTWLNDSEEDKEISAVIDCIQKYLQ